MSTSSPTNVAKSHPQPDIQASTPAKTDKEKQITTTLKKERIIAFKFSGRNLGFTVVERKGGRGLKVQHVTKQLLEAGLRENFIVMQLSSYDMRKANLDVWRKKLKLCKPPITVRFTSCPSAGDGTLSSGNERKESLGKKQNGRARPDADVSSILFFIFIAIVLVILFFTVGLPFLSYLSSSISPHSHHHTRDRSMSSFFDFGGNSGPAQVESIGLKVYVSLSDIYLGNSIEIEPGRVQRMCPHCHGTGCKNGDEHHKHTCSKCRGRGVIVQRQQLFGGMVIPMEMDCPVCGGRGYVIHKKCGHCDGSGYIVEERTLTTVLPKGLAEGSRLTLKGEGHQIQGYTSGDIILEIYSDQHAIFRRDDLDLYAKVDITLLEALTGVDTSLTHMDGRKIPIKITEVVHPGTVVTIKKDGMHGDYRKGDLHVSFHIIFPDSVDPGSGLREVLEQHENSAQEPVIIKNDKFQDKSEL